MKEIYSHNVTYMSLRSLLTRGILNIIPEYYRDAALEH